jgi:hypothetical protein
LNSLGACFFNLILARREMYVGMRMDFVEEKRMRKETGRGNRKGNGENELCGEGGIEKETRNDSLALTALIPNIGLYTLRSIKIKDAIKKSHLFFILNIEGLVMVSSEYVVQWFPGKLKLYPSVHLLSFLFKHLLHATPLHGSSL